MEVKQKMQGWAWRNRGDTAEPGDSARVLCGRRGRVDAADREVQFGACFGQADEQELLRMATAGPWEGLPYRAQKCLVSPCSTSVPLLLSGDHTKHSPAGQEPVAQHNTDES